MGRSTGEQKGMLSVEPDELETMKTGPQPVLWQRSDAGDLPTLIKNGVHDVFAQVFEAFGSVSVGESSSSEAAESRKEEKDRLVQEENLYKVKRKRFEKTLCEKVAMKEVTSFLVDMKRTVSPSGRERSLSMSRSENLIFCLS